MINNKHKLCLYICLLLSTLMKVDGQTVLIPDSLKENANAVILNYTAKLNQSDINNATYSETKTITILNEKGAIFGNFYFVGDNFTELKDFSGVLKNALGVTIKKIGKKDLITSTISEQMATDVYTMIYNCKSPSYPYTIEYNFTQKFKNRIIGYPTFSPIITFNQSILNAEYSLEIPANMNLRHYDVSDRLRYNFKNETIGDKQIYSFSANNIKAIDEEPNSPSFREIVPKVFIAPNDFCYDSRCGSMKSWQEYGVWVGGLLKNRDIIPDNLITKLKELTQNAKTDREKVKIVYEYLQNNSRYVSIQLGIGGLQPIEASSVAKTGFGDCKGLSNLMKAMLKAIGIESNYCEINMNGEKNLYKDFPSRTQTNHAILLVPLKNDSIWLECTSQILPFGYIHDGIAGHDALVITENGAQICALPNYSAEQNKSELKLLFNIAENGTSTANLEANEYFHNYFDSNYYINSNDRDKQMKYINSIIKLPHITIGKINTSEEKSETPSCSIKADLEAKDFINKTGSRLFIPICPIKKYYTDSFTASIRNQDIEKDNGFSEIDTVIFNLPDDLSIESFPKDISLKIPFGTFETETKVDGNKLTYTQKIVVNAGRYNKSEYAEIKNFYSQINAASNKKFILKKKN